LVCQSSKALFVYGLSANALILADRVNISNAKVYDLATDLGLETKENPDSTKFNTALVIFFVPYCLFEIPSNMLLKKFKPHVWLSVNMFLFGFTTLMQGLVKNYAGLLATRFFLGVFETGMFPGGMSSVTSYSVQLMLTLNSVQRFTSSACGISEAKRKSDTPSSSTVRPWPVLLVVFLPRPLARWTACRATRHGAGSSSSRAASPSLSASSSTL
jgi:hypothetical protein